MTETEEKMDGFAAEKLFDPEEAYQRGMELLLAEEAEDKRGQALRLIMASAEAEYPKAMEKLAEMYSCGDGVQKDIRAAVKWQEKRIDLWKKTGADGAEDRKILDVFLKAALYWKETGNKKEMRRSTEELLAICRERYKIGDGLSRYDLAAALFLQADQQFLEWNLGLAEEGYQETLKLIEELSGVDDHPDCTQMRIRCYDRLGTICSRKGDTDDALYFGRKALKILEEINSENLQARIKILGIEVCTALFEYSMEDENLSASMNYCDKAMKYLEGDLLKDQKSFLAVENLANALKNAGVQTYTDEDTVKPAAEYVEKAIELLERIASEDQSAEELLESCYEFMEDMNQMEGNLLKVWKYRKRRKKNRMK